HCLRPVAFAPCIVADEAGIGAMLAHNADLGLLGEGLFEPVGQPVGVGIPDHYTGGRHLRLFLRRQGRTGLIRRAFPTTTIVAVIARPGREKSVEWIVVSPLRAPVIPAAPIPELRLRRQ